MKRVDSTTKTNGKSLSNLPNVTPHRTEILGSWAVTGLTAFLLFSIVLPWGA